LAAPGFSAVALSAICMMPVSSLGSLAGIPMRSLPCFPAKSPTSKPVHADVNDDGSVARAVAGAWAVVNTVSLYVERGEDTFHAVHVAAAKRIAMLADEAGAETLVHISGIGAHAGSVSPYIRSRGEGEAAVLDVFSSASWFVRRSCSDR